MSNQTQQPADPAKNEVQKAEPTQSERFMAAVLKEFQGNAGFTELTNYQKRLIQNYFIKIDMVLADAEQKRQFKNQGLADDSPWKNNVPYTWAYVNMKQLAFDVVAFSGVGLDAMQANHTNPIPFKPNKASNYYNISFIHGYKGIEVKARKYGLDVPDNVVIEVVYKNDKFRAIKKDRNNPIDTYEFEQEPFDRGDIIGGFYYHEFTESPEKNKLKVFNMHDIEKRKPDNAAAEFWGGTKEKKKWNKDTRQYEMETEEVEGWLDEMVYKTIARSAWGCITIDSQKIDENYLKVMQRERDQKDLRLEEEIKDKANKIEEGFKEDELPNDEKQSAITDIQAEEEKKTVSANQDGPDWQ